MSKEDEITVMLINPFYTVSIDPASAGPQETMVGEKTGWSEQAAHQRARRRRLAAPAVGVLEGNYPTTRNPTIADGYSRESDA